MTLTCNCDMPLSIYADWLQDQGWEVDELRSEEEVVLTWSLYLGGQPTWWVVYGDGIYFGYYHCGCVGGGTNYGGCEGFWFGNGLSLTGDAA